MEYVVVVDYGDPASVRNDRHEGYTDEEMAWDRFYHEVRGYSWKHKELDYVVELYKGDKLEAYYVSATGSLVGAKD